MTDSWLTVGRVKSVSAGTREVRVNAQADFAYVFNSMTWIRFQRGADTSLRCKVLRTRLDGSTFIVRLSPGVSRDIVGALRGAVVIATADELPPAPEASFGVRHWIGFSVVLHTGSLLGTVAEVYEGPANDAFAVKRPDGGQSILPVIDAVIVAVDMKKREIRVGDITPYVVED